MQSLRNLIGYFRVNGLFKTIWKIFGYSVDNLSFFLKAASNLTFNYHLKNGHIVKFYPRGQIAKNLYIGGYEREEISLFCSFLKPGMNIVDVGANIGIYSIIANAILIEKSKIWAFEPSNQNFRRLLANLSANKCSLVTPIRMGLGNKINEYLYLRRDAGNGDAEKYCLPMNMTPMEKLPNIGEAKEYEKITLTSLDCFMQMENNTKVDFLKIDAEGYEFFVLLGAKTVISQNPQMAILLECTDLGTRRAGHTQQDVYNLLDSFGMKIFCWNESDKSWKTSVSDILKSGSIWAARSSKLLPTI
jgi:FkbM family methyltransferase